MLDNRHLMRTQGLFVACALACLACSDGGRRPTAIVHPTLIGVSPLDFLGGVPCRESEGAMRLYNATLYDVTEEQPVEVFQLPSSSLVPCTKDVTFSFVRVDHRYVALVQGYDRVDIEPQRPGSPNAVDRSGRVVQPRWTTQCGRAPLDLEQLGNGGQGGAESEPEMGSAGEGGSSASMFEVEGVTSNLRFTVYTSTCTPLSDQTSGTPTSVRVSLDGALREISCGTGPERISEFSVAIQGADPQEQRAQCDGSVLFSGLEPGVDVTFQVQAYSDDSVAPGWRTQCRARPELGTTVDADCDPLADILP